MIPSLATTAPTRFLDVGGTRFAYRRFGTPAGTPLVFTQHFMGNLDNFDPAISDALAPGREIILFDNAGVGRSTGTAPSTIAGLAADATSFIDALGLMTVDILGHSMGGEIAQLIAVDRPDLVRRLVLVGTGPRGGDAIARQAPEVAPLFTTRAELGQDMWLPIMFSPSKESQAAGRAFISRITARTDDRDIPVSDETIAAYGAAARGWSAAPADNFGYLAGIAQPALVVNGSNDIVIPTINSYHLYQHLPDAELMLLPDSGHGAHFQYAERFVRRVIDFIDVQPHDPANHLCPPCARDPTRDPTRDPARDPARDQAVGRPAALSGGGRCPGRPGSGWWPGCCSCCSSCRGPRRRCMTSIRLSGGSRRRR